MNRDKEVMKYFPDTMTDMESLAMLKRIHLHFENNNFGLFAVEDKSTNQFIGFTGFNIPKFDSFFTPCIEIGWRYKKEAWGQGFASESAVACLEYGFNVLGFDKILSFTSAVNVNSEKLMKRIGMTFIGFFNHPQIEMNNILCRHVIYQISKNSLVC